MYVRPISTRLLRGMLTPEMRAMSALPLPLLVALVLADHKDPAVAPDDLALLAHRLDRRSYLHVSFRADPGDAALGAGTAPATTPRMKQTLAQASLGRLRARPGSIATCFPASTWRMRGPPPGRPPRTSAAQAAAARTVSCQGVRMRGPAAVMATVNSKCAVSDPS